MDMDDETRNTFASFAVNAFVGGLLWALFIGFVVYLWIGRV
jgi:hypothetical protein